MKQKPTRLSIQNRHELAMQEGERTIALLVGGLGGYLTAEVVLRNHPHLWHWIAAGVIGGLSVLGVRLWQRRPGKFR